MRRICVYCGSNPGRDPVYAQAATALGRALAENGFGLVYGGASTGIMGVVANAVLSAGGDVRGVIPRALMEKEIAHDNLSELHVVGSMHERKSMMSELSDAFIALPGGYGTLEEIIETLTWGQLKFHSKPCGLLNINGYFDHLLQYLEHAEEQGFLKTQHRRMLLVDDEPHGLLQKFESYRPPESSKWRGH